jgi:hypothetical protein
MVFLVLKLCVLHILLSPIELYLRSTKKDNVKNSLCYKGDFTNRLVSILCILNVLYLSYKNVLFASVPDQIIIYYLTRYLFYDMIYMSSSISLIKHNKVFIVHHIITLFMLYISYNLNFGASVIIIFETTSPFLNVIKISEVITPRYTKSIKAITKNFYFFFRILLPPVWLVYTFFKIYNSWRRNIVFAGVILLWKVSIFWWKKMLD